MVINRFASVASSHAALFMFVVSGCASDQGGAAPDFETDPALVRAALENPVISCQEAALDCAVNAPDSEARGVCRDDLGTCLKGAADKADGAVSALADCRTQGRECLDNGGDLQSCRPDYEACIEAAVNNPGGATPDPVTPPADDAGVVAPPDNGNGPDNDNGNGNGLPGVDGGLLDRLPKATKCIVELRLCVLNDPLNLQDCADAARACVNAP